MSDPVAWARERLVGPLQVEQLRARPWGSTWRLTGPDGVAFLKAGTSVTGYEAALVQALAELAPSLLAPVLASEPGAGWLLLADAGRVLQDHQDGGLDLATWRSMLARFGQLQRLAEPLVPSLLAVGVPDERDERLSALLEEVLGSLSLAGLSRSERAAIPALRTRLADGVAELAQLAIPPSIQHGDLHDGNVCLGPDGLARFIDFGDASIAHPFSALLIPLRVARSRGVDEAGLRVLREAYLEMFTELGPLTQMRRGLDVALAIAPLMRMASWRRALACAPEGHEWDQAVLESTRELLAPGA